MTDAAIAEPPVKNIEANFEDGAPVAETLVVYFNKTSAYSSDEKSKIRDICAEAARTVGTLCPLEQLSPIKVFVSGEIPSREEVLGLAHPIGSERRICQGHAYKADSIEVQAIKNNMDDVPRVALHELIHAVHLRNEHARKRESDYIQATKRMSYLLEVYLSVINDEKTRPASTFYDGYSGTDIYEFVVGVVEVLLGKDSHLRQLTEFVEKNRPIIKEHVPVILNPLK